MDNASFEEQSKHVSLGALEVDLGILASGLQMREVVQLGSLHHIFGRDEVDLLPFDHLHDLPLRAVGAYASVIRSSEGWVGVLVSELLRWLDVHSLEVNAQALEFHGFELGASRLLLVGRELRLNLLVQLTWNRMGVESELGSPLLDRVEHGEECGLLVAELFRFDTWIKSLRKPKIELLSDCNHLLGVLSIAKCLSHLRYVGLEIDGRVELFICLYFSVLKILYNNMSVER